MKEMADAMVISQASAIEPAIREMSDVAAGANMHEVRRF